jgi:UDP-N-acetylglucosamine 2-epimerase (non-hydrolysing)
VVLVVGDVNSTLACSIVAKKLNFKVAHIEAGLRSGDLRMPEEINRIVTDSITDYFFVTEKSAVGNLVAEGKRREAIFFVGHVMIDNLFHQLTKLKELPAGSQESDALKLEHPGYGVVTLHRPSNVDNSQTLAGLFGAMEAIARRVPLIFPIHPRTQARLDQFGIRAPKGMITIKPQPYMAFLNLFKDARLVLTDSGGIQEETTVLGIPCLTLRPNTERPITVLEGTNRLVGNTPEVITREAFAALDRPAGAARVPELWDGHAAPRIVDAIEEASR